MNKDVNIDKVIRQYSQMEDFLSGGFTVRGKRRSAAQSRIEAQNADSADDVANDDVAKGLAKIAAEVNKCCKCGLGSSRTHAVPGEGNIHAKLVFVGEAPGADEDAQGRPFVGRSGKLLDDILKAMNLSREDVFICNIVKCRPPDNRDPQPNEIISCLPFLKAQLELINPQIIVALGAHAARTLLNTNEAIGKLRGIFHDYYISPDKPPVKLMPTYHPAYLLRNYSVDNRRRVWEDMKKVVAELEKLQ